MYTCTCAVSPPTSSYTCMLYTIPAFTPSQYLHTDTHTHTILHNHILVYTHVHVPGKPHYGLHAAIIIHTAPPPHSPSTHSPPPPAPLSRHVDSTTSAGTLLHAVIHAHMATPLHSPSPAPSPWQVSPVESLWPARWSRKTLWLREERSLHCVTATARFLAALSRRRATCRARQGGTEGGGGGGGRR